MKYALLLLTASLVIASSGAFAQANTDACHTVTDHAWSAAPRGRRGVQESCSNTCEANTNQCYCSCTARSLGRRASRRRRNSLRLRIRGAKRPRRSQVDTKSDAETRRSTNARSLLTDWFWGDARARRLLLLLADDAPRVI